MVIQIVQAMLSSPNCLLRLEAASLWQNVGIALSAAVIKFAHTAWKIQWQKQGHLSMAFVIYYIILTSIFIAFLKKSHVFY